LQQQIRLGAIHEGNPLSREWFPFTATPSKISLSDSAGMLTRSLDPNSANRRSHLHDQLNFLQLDGRERVRQTILAMYGCPSKGGGLASSANPHRVAGRQATDACFRGLGQAWQTFWCRRYRTRNGSL